MSLQASQVKKQKSKKRFKMPHMLFLMLGLIFFVSIMTYVIPSGEFIIDSATVGSNTQAFTGEFSFLKEQTPVSPWQSLLYISQGFVESSFIIVLVLFAGGSIGIIMNTGALAEVVDYAVYRLRDKGVNVLVPVMFILMGLVGGFGGGDQLVAVVPVGVMFARKLRLDPISAAAVTFMATIIGFSTSPTRLTVPQLMMNVIPYSGYGVRLFVMAISLIIGAIYTTLYARKVLKDPSKSLMGNTEWVNDFEGESKNDSGEVKISSRAIIVTILFFVLFVSVIIMLTVFKMSMSVMPATQLLIAILCGLIYKMSFDEIGNIFAKGVGDMAIVGIMVGLAGTMSIIMKEGHILHTIVHYASIPLQGLGAGSIAIGISIVVMSINIFIPSSTSKAAILIPIVQPLAMSLGVPSQVAVQAFQVGDGFTNSITPSLGWTVGAMQISRVKFNQWWKFAIPLVVILSVLNYIILYILASIGWTGI